MAVSESPDQTALPNPETLVEREDVDVAESTYPHEDTDHCEHGADGRVVVGVTNAAGEVLLQVHESAPYAMLPNEVADDGDWADAARRAGEQCGVSVELGGIRRVRVVDHYLVDERPEEWTAPLPDDATFVETTHHLLVEASVTEADPAAPRIDDEDWTVGWHDDRPVETDEGDGGDTVADVRTILG